MSCREDYTGNKHNTPEAFALYLKELAALNNCLSHTDAEPHYFRGELEEFYTGFRDRVNFPALIQEAGEIRYTSDNADNAFKERESAFMIVQGYEDDSDYDQIYAAFDLCEKIGDEIIRRMNMDKYRPECMVVKDFSFEDVSAVCIQNVRERYAGVRYSFTTKTPFWNETDPNKWKDE
ncbi:hypothetical protein LJC68_06210 [Bacteroidales bacterium OttesenSCG-928-B11]|nr:hypothetical protein [Bacteroidales bacterium OttesenSCG-928-B11]